MSTSFDPVLQELAKSRDGVKLNVEALRVAVEKELDLETGSGRGKAVSQDSIPNGRSGGVCFRVTKKHQQTVQHWKGKTTFKAVSIKKGEYLFTCAALEKLNETLCHATGLYDQQSSTLADRALNVAATYTGVVERLGEVLGRLDVLAAFARVAVSAPCTFVRPKLDPTGKEFSVRGATHVLVVANSDQSYVANDLLMDRDTSRCHLITGPNMGGKSTYIRSAALIALLNQVGSFVPCQEATLPVFDAIMCRVGASDMQLRGISTFMAEMLEASCILSTATERSLVIIDELGRGTSTGDGLGIAWAIAKHLAEATGCFSLFATHFHELSELAQATPGVRNRHATAAVDPKSGKLTFLYALADGCAEKSYGAHVAELAGFPAAVVGVARKRAQELEEGTFGSPVDSAASPAAKRARVDDTLAYVWGAADADAFVARVMAQVPQLRAQCYGIAAAA